MWPFPHRTYSFRLIQRTKIRNYCFFHLVNSPAHQHLPLPLTHYLFHAAYYQVSTTPFFFSSQLIRLCLEIDQQENFMHSEYKIKISEIFVNLSTIKEIAENETALTSSIGVNLLEKTDVDAAIKIITQANRSNTVIDVKMNDLKFKLKSMDTFYDLYRILNSILKCFQSIQQSNQNENKEDFIHLIHEDYKNVIIFLFFTLFFRRTK